MAMKVQKDTKFQKEQEVHNHSGKRLYTLKEAAQYLGRSVWGMRDLVWSQIIPVVKQQGSRKIYIDITDLDGFIEKNKAIYN